MAFSTVSRMFNQVTLDHGSRELYHYKNNDSSPESIEIQANKINYSIKRMNFLSEPKCKINDSNVEERKEKE